VGWECCVVSEGVDVCPGGMGSWLWVGVDDKCPVVGVVDGYDGMGVCGFCCVYVLEGSGWACGGCSREEVVFNDGDG